MINKIISSVETRDLLCKMPIRIDNHLLENIFGILFTLNVLKSEF